MKKFELTTETKVVFGRALYRIKALIAFGNVEAGELGGWIEKESNLSQDGGAWVSDNAKVYGNAWVFGTGKTRNGEKPEGSVMQGKVAGVMLMAERTLG